MTEEKSYNPKSEENILRKIKALLARAESTPYENERELCTEQAQRLMVKYSIDSAKVGIHDDQYVRSVTNFIVYLEPQFAREKITMLHQITEAFNSKMIWLDNHDSKFYRDSRGRLTRRKNHPGREYAHLFGHERDLDMTWSLVMGLLPQLDASLYAQPFISHSYRKSFVIAYGMRVAERIKQYYSEALAEEAVAGTGTELVLANRLELAQGALENEYPETIPASSPDSWQHALGHAHGREQGDRADISLFSRKVEEDVRLQPIGS